MVRPGTVHALGGPGSVLANGNVGDKATVTISASDKALKSTGFGPRAKR